MREKGQTEVAKTLETPVFSRGIEILTEKFKLIKKIREEAYAYLHGHEVGGTNPSLLEALASTKINLLLDVGFNKEVAGQNALYWSKKTGDLAALIDRADELPQEEISRLDHGSTEQIVRYFSWEKICADYEAVFQNELEKAILHNSASSL